MNEQEIHKKIDEVLNYNIEASNEREEVREFLKGFIDGLMDEAYLLGVQDERDKSRPKLNLDAPAKAGEVVWSMGVGDLAMPEEAKKRIKRLDARKFGISSEDNND